MPVLGAERRKQAGAECFESFISYSSKEKTCWEKISTRVFFNFFFFNLAHYVKHVGGLFASLSVYFV